VTNEKRTDYSLDLETLSTRYDASILVIACAKFDIVTGDILGDFTMNVRCPEDKFHIDVDTVMWWLKQDEQARHQLTKQDVHWGIEAALHCLTDFLSDEGCVWGNGATFDITILEHAYLAASQMPPWDHWNVRDMRTIVDIAETDAMGFDRKWVKFEGTPHVALDDAKHQARVISAAYMHLINTCG